MAYSDQKYISREMTLASLPTQNFGTNTATASGHVVTATAAARLKKYIRATKISAIRVAVDTGTPVGQTTPQMIFLNGTATMGVVNVAIGTATAGAYIDATMTAANANLTAGTQPTVNFVGTATASAAVINGSFTVYFEEQELPS